MITLEKDYGLSLFERRGWYCEYCHLRRATQKHHALFGRMKRYPELDAEENMMIVCPDCHTGKELLDTQEVREWFWKIQCERYGLDHMLAWIKSLPLKVKPALYR